VNRLSDKTIETILEKFQQGMSVNSISKELGLSPMNVYYHTKKKGTCRVKGKAKSYLDYVHNGIYRLEQRLKTENLTDAQVRGTRDEIFRLRTTIKNWGIIHSEDAFIQQ